MFLPDKQEHTHTTTPTTHATNIQHYFNILQTYCLILINTLSICFITYAKIWKMLHETLSLGINNGNMTEFSDLDMDAYNASNKVGKDELLFYIRCWDGKANIFVSGDPGVMIGALFTMFDSIENSFDTVLDAVLQYAEENDIDLENYFDGV